MAAENSTSQPTRTASQIEADLAATRLRLANQLESLIDEIHPKRVKQRQVAGIKQFAHTELERARGLVFNARGDLRTNRLATAGLAAAGAVVFLLVVRALARRGGG